MRMKRIMKSCQGSFNLHNYTNTSGDSGSDGGSETKGVMDGDDSMSWRCIYRIYSTSTICHADQVAMSFEAQQASTGWIRHTLAEEAASRGSH